MFKAKMLCQYLHLNKSFGSNDNVWHNLGQIKDAASSIEHLINLKRNFGQKGTCATPWLWPVQVQFWLPAAVAADAPASSRAPVLMAAGTAGLPGCPDQREACSWMSANNRNTNNIIYTFVNTHHDYQNFFNGQKNGMYTV